MCDSDGAPFFPSVTVSERLTAILTGSVLPLLHVAPDKGRGLGAPQPSVGHAVDQHEGERVLAGGADRGEELGGERLPLTLGPADRPSQTAQRLPYTPVHSWIGLRPVSEAYHCTR